ncbi:MAG: hypothetical protein JWQ34_2636 [Mucilaginibacter sp.]|nr:hypothetical protein [Mucilaginibacter sp.]
MIRVKELIQFVKIVWFGLSHYRSRLVVGPGFFMAITFHPWCSNLLLCNYLLIGALLINNDFLAVNRELHPAVG